MKFPPVLLAVALIALAPNLSAQITASQALTEGQRAYYSGNTELAETRFMQVLEVDPKNQTATGFLRSIRTQKLATNNAGAQLEKQFKALVLPKVELHDVSVTDALERLKQLANKQTEGKLVPNFVAKLPTETLEQKLNLSLANVPFTEALKYVGELAELHFTFDKYAIVVKKKGDGAPPQATVVQTPPPSGTTPP